MLNSELYLDYSLDTLHDHGGFHRYSRHAHRLVSMPLQVIYLFKEADTVQLN